MAIKQLFSKISMFNAFHLSLYSFVASVSAMAGPGVDNF